MHKKRDLVLIWKWSLLCIYFTSQFGSFCLILMMFWGNYANFGQKWILETFLEITKQIETFSRCRWFLNFQIFARFGLSEHLSSMCGHVSWRNLNTWETFLVSLNHLNLSRLLFYVSRNSVFILESAEVRSRLRMRLYCWLELFQIVPQRFSEHVKNCILNYVSKLHITSCRAYCLLLSSIILKDLHFEWILFQNLKYWYA